MATIKKFEDIEAWQKGRELKRIIYQRSRCGEFAKDFALRDQIRRAAISVTANIAEGFERAGNREFIQFLSDAKGSCGEVQDHLYTALDEQYLTQDEFQRLYEQAAEVGRLIGGFMNYLQRSDIRGPKFRTDFSGQTNRSPDRRLTTRDSAPECRQPETQNQKPETFRR